ncbi:MAG: flavodoxin domain-containing protein [Chloroflexota bacterium]
MRKILILYYSRTGNTEKMANAVAEGVRTVANVQADTEYHINAEDLNKYDAILVGTSTYHHDVPIDIKHLFEEASNNSIILKDKIGAAFGSYGWSGEAPKLVLEIMKNKFEMRIPEQPLLARNTPDQSSLNQCRELGKRISETLIKQNEIQGGEKSD